MRQLPRRGRRWFRAHLPRRKGGRPLHPSSSAREAPRAWAPSLWTEPCEQSGGAGCQRGPFKSHEPETLRNPHAIRSRRSVSLGSSCRARPAAVHRPSQSTQDEPPALKPLLNAGGSAARRCRSRPVGCWPCRRGTGSRAEPGESLPTGKHRLIPCARGERQAVGFHPPAEGFPAVAPRAIQLVEVLKKTPYPTGSLTEGTNGKQFGFTFPDVNIIPITPSPIEMLSCFFFFVCVCVREIFFGVLLIGFCAFFFFFFPCKPLPFSRDVCA